MIEHLIAQWGYIAILAGTFLEGETVLLIGGAMAHHGLLSLPLVVLCAFGASFLGDQMWFVVGRRWGPGFLRKRPAWAKPAERVRRWLERWGTAFVLAFRFIYGIRVLTPVMLGASDYPASRFVPLNALGAALWACLVTGLGWGVGEGLTQVLGRAGKVEERALVAVLVGVGIALLARHWTRGKAARAPQE